MSWSTHPVTLDRFEDFADVINPNRRGEHCWCTPHRLRAADVRELGDGDREQAMRALCSRDTPPGILAYSGDKAVGWCNVGARDDIPKLVHSKLIRPLDQVPVWSIVCLVVRGGHRKQGVSARLIEGAVEFAASRGAPAVESYPVDPSGRMDTTMAFVGTRRMFEKAGFDVVGQTKATASKMPRLIMRRLL
ncbi:MAG: GNAT family N-acetyltransferase [Ornithinimicrobium sp.]